MNEKIKSTFKSGDTEEWLDIVWTRPIGYRIAKMCEALDIHPNTVTIASMIIGALSCLFFVHGSFYYEGLLGFELNIVAICMLAYANILDSADGQLARMTGKKTQLGRILDGAASEVWFIPIYVSLVYRFYLHHDIEFSWLGIADTDTARAVATAVLFALVLLSGFVCHAGQCRLADYYRQIHLLIVNGKEGSELDSSQQQQEIYNAMPWKGHLLEKAFQATYVNYTCQQEKDTPQFQALRRKMTKLYGGIANAPQAVRERFRQRSLPLMKYTNILTFNTRAIVLYLLALLDVPALYFLFETIIMSLLAAYMRHRHETMCREMLG